MSRKFDDCVTCRFKAVRPGHSPCADCDMGEQYEDRDRAACGPVAPSTGLYLTGVVY